VLGGAALGIAVVAGAIWWHERHPAGSRLPGTDAPRALWGEALYRWQSVIVFAFVAVLFLQAPMADDAPLLDVIFDVAGGACIFVGLLLRLLVAGHGDRRPAFPKLLPTRFVATRPYAHMRHPVPLSTLLIGVGLVLLAENGPGLTLIPAILIAMFRITIPLEEVRLVQRCGSEYTRYCERVPRWPRPRRALFAAAVSAMFTSGSGRWQCVVQELPAVVTTLVLAALAEASEFMPHLLR